MENEIKDSDKAAQRKAYEAAWRAKNADRVRAASAAYRVKNSEKIKTYYADNADKQKAAALAWQKANPERVLATKLAYAEAHPEKSRECTAAYRKANPDRVKASIAAWAKANPGGQQKASDAWLKRNPGAIVVYAQNRRARKIAGGGVLSMGLADRLMDVQQGICPCCNLPLDGKYHLDHWMPLALGGSNTDDNIRLLHPRCNLKKGSKHPEDYMRSQVDQLLAFDR